MTLVRYAPGDCVGPTHVPDLLYINDIGENTKVQIGLFADDTAFYFGVIKD